ncbi:hypothetical protein GQ457_03G020070 [Hibiscus cannabinus]
MITIFFDMIEHNLEVFMDDFSVFRRTFDECLLSLEQVLKRCTMTNLVMNWEKCYFMVKEGIVLGHKIMDRAKHHNFLYPSCKRLFCSEMKCSKCSWKLLLLLDHLYLYALGSRFMDLSVRENKIRGTSHFF